MLYREIIAAYSQIHTKHINTLCELNAEFVIVKPGGTVTNVRYIEWPIGFRGFIINYWKLVREIIIILYKYLIPASEWPVSLWKFYPSRMLLFDD